MLDGDGVVDVWWYEKGLFYFLETKNVEKVFCMAGGMWTDTCVNCIHIHYFTCTCLFHVFIVNSVSERLSIRRIHLFARTGCIIVCIACHYIASIISNLAPTALTFIKQSTKYILCLEGVYKQVFFTRNKSASTWTCKVKDEDSHKFLQISL